MQVLRTLIAGAVPQSCPPDADTDAIGWWTTGLKDPSMAATILAVDDSASNPETLLATVAKVL
jgi:hypothetical protein